MILWCFKKNRKKNRLIKIDKNFIFYIMKFMKKIISQIILITILFILSFQTSMANFTMHIWEIKSENTSMNSSDCCEKMQKDCENTKHECCYSPFKNSSNISNLNTQSPKKEKFKWKILDYSFLAILNNNFKVNYKQKLTSPPNKNKTIIKITSYTSLVWIIKNIC